MRILNKIKKIKLPKIGMRSIKTVIATLVAIIISELLGFESPFYPTMVAFLCIQGSIIESSEVAINRVKGTLVGGLFALLYLVLVPGFLYVVPIGILLIIYFCNALGRRELITVASIVFLVICFSESIVKSTDTVIYVMERMLETFIGIAIAMLVNSYIKPPNPFDKLKILNNEMTEIIKSAVNDEGNFNKVKDLEDYRLKMDEFRNLIQFYHKEISSRKYDIDIKYYMKHLTLFRSAYSYIFILVSTKGKMDEDIHLYHITNLQNIKDELLK